MRRNSFPKWSFNAFRCNSLSGQYKSSSNSTASSYKRKYYYNKWKGHSGSYSSSQFILFPELLTESSPQVLFPELYYYP